MKIIECPRDAMQGLKDFIPTASKIEYLNALLRVGFDTLDFGSFVSPKAIPQMRDTHEVIQALDRSQTTTRLLAIVANVRGAEDACNYEHIHYLGFPFSISETFQLRNTNASIAKAMEQLQVIQELAVSGNKELVAYISMGFGNPYGDPYSTDLVMHYAEKLAEMGINIISLADTIGTSNRASIEMLFPKLTEQFPEVEIGAHLHTRPEDARDKVEALLACGIDRIDAAMKGMGGCPMAKDDLTGNLATETLLSVLKEKDMALSINEDEFHKAIILASKLFPLSDHG
jgi:hydroxymethylglutaryl-CoA lyase